MQFFKARSQPAGLVERGEAIIFNQGATLPMVIIQIACDSRSKQRGEMVKAVAVMPAHRGVEGDSDLAGIGFIGNLPEQYFALAQSFNDGLN